MNERWKIRKLYTNTFCNRWVLEIYCETIEHFVIKLLIIYVCAIQEVQQCMVKDSLRIMKRSENMVDIDFMFIMVEHQFMVNV